jgi:hypothetical protein
LTGGAHGVSVRRVLDGRVLGAVAWPNDDDRNMSSMQLVPGHTGLLITASFNLRIDLWDVDAGTGSTLQYYFMQQCFMQKCICRLVFGCFLHSSSFHTNPLLNRLLL